MRFTLKHVYTQVFVCCASASAAWCSGTGLPWEQPIANVSQSVIGTYAPYGCAVAFVSGLLAWGFGGQHSDSVLKPIFNYGGIAAMSGGAITYVTLMGAPAGATLSMLP